MPSLILVTYATRYGSTREVAEAVAATLTECGCLVDILPIASVERVADYRAVVLGAPFYIGHWHKDMQHFLERHRSALAQLPVAVFALGPLGCEAQEWQDVRTLLDHELAHSPWLHPVARELFGGKFDPAILRFADRLITRLPASPLHDHPPSDGRDWAAIRAWATTLAATLQPGLQSEEGVT